MKIEKVNENQIRCILTKEELAGRQLKLSELAYGTENARALFHDLMQKAALELGFRAENVPLMIEAIPLGSDSIALIVTKVESPEELDTRFTNFSPSVQSEAASADPPQGFPFAADKPESSPFEHLMNSLRSMHNADSKNAADRRLPISGETAPAGNTAPPPEKTPSPARSEMEAFQELIYKNRLFAFDSLRTLIEAAHRISDVFTGESDLYLEEKRNTYHLLLRVDTREQADEMRRVFAFLTEYGTPEMFSIARREHLSEHCSSLFTGDALDKLNTL